MDQGFLHFARKLAALLIFFCEKPVELLPEHLGSTPTKNALGAQAPAGHQSRFICADDGGVASPIDNLPQLRRREAVGRSVRVVPT